MVAHSGKIWVMEHIAVTRSAPVTECNVLNRQLPVTNDAPASFVSGRHQKARFVPSSRWFDNPKTLYKPGGKIFGATGFV
jgi:hypothetical protein